MNIDLLFRYLHVSDKVIRVLLILVKFQELRYNFYSLLLYIII